MPALGADAGRQHRLSAPAISCVEPAPWAIALVESIARSSDMFTCAALADIGLGRPNRSTADLSTPPGKLELRRRRYAMATRDQITDRSLAIEQYLMSSNCGETFMLSVAQLWSEKREVGMLVMESAADLVIL